MTSQISAMEGDGVELACGISSAETDGSFSYKVAWLYAARGSSGAALLVELDHAGLLSYPQDTQALAGLQGRLRLSRPSQRSFRLGVRGVHEGDGGAFWCQVEQYQLDEERRWQQRASHRAGPTELIVNVPGTASPFMEEA